MAYVQDEELKRQQQAAAGGGQVLAGSGGAVGASKASGTGWTNLQSYLDANQGNTGGIATSVNKAMDKEFEGAAKAADDSAAAFTKSAVDTAQANDPSKKMVPGSTMAETIANSKATYDGPATVKDVQGYNDLEKNYKTAEQAADKYTGYSGMKEGLASQNNYGSGFGALDAFLGVRREMPAIKGQADANKAGLKTEDGRYRGQAQAEIAYNSELKAMKQRMANSQNTLADTIEKQGRAEGRIFDTPTISTTGAVQTESPFGTSGGIAGGVVNRAPDGTPTTWQELLLEETWKPSPIVDGDGTVINPNKGSGSVGKSGRHGGGGNR